HVTSRAAGPPGPPRRCRHPDHGDDGARRAGRARGLRVRLRRRPAEAGRRHRLAHPPAGDRRGAVMDRTIAEALGEFAAKAAVPDPVAHSVAQRVLDILGIAVAATQLETSAAVADYARAQGGAPQATAVGIPERLPAALAALVNGTLAHSLDYDDTHLPSVLHPSAAVIPAALAAAEAHGADEATTVRAIAVGLEICVRTGMAGYDESL